jgi:hypothetical protein
MSRSRPTSTRHRFLPQVESLEDRRVPAILPIGIHLPPIHLPAAPVDGVQAAGVHLGIHLPPIHLPAAPVDGVQAAVGQLGIHLPPIHLPGPSHVNHGHHARHGHSSIPKGSLGTVVDMETLDPGTLPGVTADELKSFLSPAVANLSIDNTVSAGVEQQIGPVTVTVGVDFHVHVSNLRVLDVQVPPQVSHTTVTLQADVSVTSRLGAVGGTIQFTVQPLVQVDLLSMPMLELLGKDVPTAQNLLSARVLPQNIQVTQVHIDNVPSALTDNGTVLGWVTQMMNVAPIDVTGLVQFYLQQGGTLPPAHSQTIFHIPRGIHFPGLLGHLLT